MIFLKISDDNPLGRTTLMTETSASMREASAHARPCCCRLDGREESDDRQHRHRLTRWTSRTRHHCRLPEAICTMGIPFTPKAIGAMSATLTLS
jgi:hypothetical protein